MRQNFSTRALNQTKLEQMLFPHPFVITDYTLIILQAIALRKLNKAENNTFNGLRKGLLGIIKIGKRTSTKHMPSTLFFPLNTARFFIMM